MNNGGEAAEQMFRMTLEGTEFAVKIVGKSAKEIAIFLYAILSQQKKSKGHVSLSNMLKTSEKTFMYSIQKPDMKQFIQRARAYGVKYHICMQDKNNAVHLMTDEKSVSKVDRIIQELGLANVDINQITKDIQRETAQKSRQGQKNQDSKAPEKTESQPPEEPGEKSPAEVPEGKQPEAPEKGVQQKTPEDKLLDAIFSKPIQAEPQSPENNAGKTAPFQTATEKSPPSEPISGKQLRDGKGTLSDGKRELAKSGRLRVSVKKELKKIEYERKAQSLGNAPARAVPSPSKSKSAR